MVSVKKKTVKGKTYIYVSTSISHKGEKKYFEKYLGPSDEEGMEDRIEFYKQLLEIKRFLYKIYLETKHTVFEYLSCGYAFPLVLIKNQYQDMLSDFYPSELEKYRSEFNVRYVHHTTAIEGNTLTLRDTSLVLNDGISPRSKKLREIHEIENYKKVMAYTESYDKEIDLDLILELHRLIQRYIDDNTAGSIRRIPIGISGSKWEPPHPIEVEEHLESLIEWYRNNIGKMHPLELAGEFHHRFLQIHPFVDGNGRIGRELLNFILTRNEYPPLIIPVESREEYMRCLEEADEERITGLLEFLAVILVNDYAAVVKGLSQTLVGEFNKALSDMDEYERNELFQTLIWIFNLFLEYVMIIPKNINSALIRSIISPPESIES